MPIVAEKPDAVVCYATVVDGKLQLDTPIELQDNTRVNLTITKLVENQTRGEKLLKALEGIKNSMKLKPGEKLEKFTRDELYDRG